MHGTTKSSGGRNASKGEPARQGLGFGAILIAAVLISAIFAFKLLKSSPEPVKPPPTVVEPKTRPAPKFTTTRTRDDFVPPAAAVPAVAEPAPSQPGPRSPRDLLAELVELGRIKGPLTKEQAEKLKRNLAELIQQGAASVPAIQEFLDKNTEFEYGAASDGDQVAYSSLRASLIDALKQIGGPEGQAAMLRTLQTTALPTELLELSKNLDEAAPGQYRDQILAAAREALAMASANQLGSNVEVGPAFRMLQNYGMANSMTDEAKNEPGNFYNAVVMANLPDGQGLPSLIEMAQNSNPDASGKTIATEMIAQLAGQNPQAVEALTQMVQKGQIDNSLWIKLAPILAGDQYQITSSTGQNSGGDANASGGQSYAIVNGATTPDQINERIALIDKFLGLVPGDSPPAKALQHERDSLVGKLGNN